MTIQAKTFDNGARTSEATAVELNRVVAQAEELLKSLGDEGGAALDAVRQRVQRTVEQAKTKLSGASARARHAANDAARATDTYVHTHPWESVAYGAAAGAALAIVLAVMLRRHS
jgi:ElaB/YqjD/DUF883 family membrane-anchored ribosome-binding protein